jgi:hypothetical protein
VPVILIAFIVMLSLAAVMPSTRDDLTAERATAGEASAGRLKAWHAAAVRACYATPGGSCGAGRVPDASVVAQMSSMLNAAGSYRQDRIVSYFDGTYVFSVYTGNDSVRRQQALADAATSLTASSRPESMANIGFWNGATGRFVPGGYTIKVTNAGVTTVAGRHPDGIPTQPAAYAPGLPTGAPMIATKVRFQG